MNKLLVATACSVALLAGPASAQLYVGAGVGGANTDVSKTSWKLFGGAQLNPTWGIEAAYTDLGRYRGSNVESRSLAGTGTLPLSERMSLVGKLGASSNRVHFAGSSNHTDGLIGVAIAYNVAKNMDIRLEYEDFGKLTDGSAGDNSKGSNWGLGLKYGF